MRFPQIYVQRAGVAFAATGIAITGVVGTTGTPATNACAVGNTIDSGRVGTTLAARVSATAFTNGLGLNVQWQVLDDNGSTWIDALESQNPSITAIVTGAGTSGGTTATAYLSPPDSLVAGSRSARAIVFTTGSGPARGAGFDFASIEYDWRSPASTFG